MRTDLGGGPATSGPGASPADRMQAPDGFPKQRKAIREPGSFRDPAGFVYRLDGELLRQVNSCYAGTWRRMRDSGLQKELQAKELLVAHEVVDLGAACTPGAIAVIRPEPIPFVSYPYEWSFSQLQDAARLTLQIQERALTKGLRLKDASAYNVQFHRGRPLFIDTLSFEPHREGEAWPAYRQFCEQFLAPLALMAHVDVRLGGRLCRTWLDGVPLPLASQLLPWHTRLRPSLLFHLHLHARAQRRVTAASGPREHRDLGQRGLEGVLASLRAAVEGLEWEPSGTPWADYDGLESYEAEDLAAKGRLVSEMLERLRPDTVWDLGANDGRFSRLAASLGAATVAFDLDPAAVERNYQQVREDGNPRVLPLLIDLTNPSPGIGWAHRERMSLMERGPADTVLALALVHHLGIGNNLPLPHIARFLASVARTLIIEFVPRSDPKVREMLASRRQLREDYDEAEFRRAFTRWFRIEETARVGGSARVLYRMQRRQRRQGVPGSEDGVSRRGGAHNGSRNGPPPASR